MFRRKKKADAGRTSREVDAAKNDRNRVPMLIAVAAGLLGVLGALGLFRALQSDDSVAVPVVATETRQVLVVLSTIAAGTPLDVVLADPTAYLAARPIPAEFVPPNAIETIGELRSLGDVMMAADATPGEQLLTSRFVDRDDFERDSFIDRAAPVQVPDGHHQIVLELPAAQALGGNVRPGDVVTVVGSFRVQPSEDGADPFNLSMVVLDAVEVVNVQSSGDTIGEFSRDVDNVGTASIGDFSITLAVEPIELTDLTYTMQYGEVTLAVALDDGEGGATRQFTVLDTMLLNRARSAETLEDLFRGDAQTQPGGNAPGLPSASGPQG